MPKVRRNNEDSFAAVSRIRDQNSDVGQRTLADKIRYGGFIVGSASDSDARDVQRAGVPLATIYNWIRRIDAESKSRATPTRGRHSRRGALAGV